jgi:starch phosphorylase
MYPGFKFENITNGVCLKRWVHPKMAEIFDERIHGWRSEPERFLGAYDNIGEKEIAGAKIAMKKEFAGYINSDKSFFLVSSPSSADKFEPDILTVGFARRFVPYKRPTLLLRDLDKLADVAGGKLQVVYSSRCYPDDSFCNGEIEIMKRAAEKLRGKIRFALIPDYNPEIAKKILTGCDVWLNNPVGGREASGTSGMKAVLNGALNLSLLDGWWIEGYHADNLSGWGKECSLLPDGQPDDASDANSLYEMLNDAVDCYYNHKIIWAARMRRAIALASYFNTHRVVKEYERKMWNSGEKTASRLGSG